MKKIVSQLSAAMLVGALVFTTSCKKEVVVTADKSSAAIGEVINFTCLEADSKLKGTFVTWDFGDGGSTTNQSNAAEIYNNNNRIKVGKSFNAAGTYTVTAIFNKSKRPTKKNAKTTFGSVDVTINSVTPSFVANDASGTAVTAVMDNQVVTFKNTTDEGTVAQSTFNYTWYDNEVAVSTAKHLVWNATPGKHTIKLRLVQGNTTTYSTTTDITVAGRTMTNSEMQAMIGGKWTVSISGSGSGTSYSAACAGTAFSPVVSNKVKTTYLDNSGNATWSISAETNTDGNLNNGSGLNVVVVNPTTVNVSGLSWNGDGNVNGLYTTTVSGSSMTLTRTEKGGATTCTFTDTFTITLSR